MINKQQPRMNTLENCTKNYSFESIWDIEDNVEDDNKEFVLNEVKKFIEDNYRYIYIKDCEIVFDEKKDKYVVNYGQHAYLNSDSKQLTNEVFEWGVVGGFFNCANCPELESLEGAPKKVGKSFDCSNCPKLKSLKGAPEEVKGDFNCSSCPITSLKGAPKEVKGDFLCRDCPKLSSLDGIGKVKGSIFSDIK